MTKSPLDKIIEHINELYRDGQADLAIQKIREFLKKTPNSTRSWNNLGVMLYQTSRYEEAVKAYRKALKLNPNFIDTLFNLAVAYMEKGFDKKAVNLFKRLIALMPQYSAALQGLAQIYVRQQKYREAITYYATLVKIDPKNSQYWQQLAILYKKTNDFTNAKKAIVNAVQIDSLLPYLHYNLGIIEEQSGNSTHAIQAYLKAIEIDDKFYQAYPQLYMAKRKACDWQGLEKIEQKLNEYNADTPFTSLVRTEDLQKNLNSAKIASSIYPLTKPDISFSFTRSTLSKKIVLGYIAKDYCDHPIGQLITPLFETHNRKKFIVKCFSYTKSDNSPYYHQIKSGSDDYFDIQKMDNLQAANLIHQQKVDILIDNTGNTAENRYHILASRPAPIQVTWMGLLGSSGADFIDYQIADPIVVPKSHFQFYSEKIIHLPLSLINNPALRANKKTPSKKSLGIPENTFVFASFNQAYKITPEIWKVWLNTLKAIPESVLLLWEREKEATKNLKNSAEVFGVNPNRLIFTHKLSTSQHLARLKQVDLAFDTPIYGGGTTTSQTLWAGVPVLTLLGGHYASRLTSSLLTAAKVPELITHSLDEYQSLAIKLAINKKSFEQVKAKLTQDVLKTNLFSLSQFTQNLEKAYAKIYSRFQQSLPPEHTTIA